MKATQTVRMIAVGLGCLALNATSLAASNPVPLTASELLDQYASTQAKLQSFYSRTQIREAGGGNRVTSSEIWFDRNRARRCSQSWGQISASLPVISARNPYRDSRLWDGHWHFQYAESTTLPKNHPHYANLLISPGVFRADSKQVPDCAVLLSADMVFMGRFLYEPDRVDVVLRQATNLAVRPRPERFNGSDCYVVEGTTRYGRYTLWLDPEHGYHIAQAIVDRRAGDYALLELERPDYRLPSGEHLHHELRNVRFAQAQGVWIPMTADTVNAREGASLASVNGTVRNHIQRTQFLLNPDHTSLRSFLPADILNGAMVNVLRTKDQRFIPVRDRCVWRDGKALDSEGNVTFDSGLTKTNSGQPTPAAK